MKKEKLSIKKSFVGIFRLIPKWFYLFLISFFLGISGTIFFFALSSPNNNLPQTQIVNDQTLMCTYAYDGKTKGPAWTLQVINHREVGLSMTNIKFYEDETIPSSMRSKILDYQNSGFDIAPLLDISENGIFNTQFPLATCSPQLPQFHRVYWDKVNKYMRELINKMDGSRGLIISGPLYLPHDEANGKRYVTYQVIGENNVAVPT
ncbi:MAG: DNA/RNA non-specific endonuclease, partial [Chlamydiota bacterium]